MVDGTRETASGGGVGLRLFAALEVPTDHARQLAELSEVVVDGIADARALPAEELHVTFAFLGDVPEEYVPGVARALEAAASVVPGPTECVAGEPVVLGRGRALALDVTFDLHALLDAARDSFVDAVRPYAPQLDARPWHPHLTLLRARSTASMERAGEQLAARLPRQAWVTGDLRLFASLPGPTARVHKLLHAVPLGLPVARG